jgi:macrolide-specific efflux system membrane fusion protein
MARNTALLLATIAVSLAPSIAPAKDVEVSSVLVKLLDQVEVPARDAGVLAKVVPREGDMVEAGAPLAQIEDADAQFEKRRAQAELMGAAKQAESDVKVRFAKKSLEVAQAELRRAVESQRRLAQSVSQSEMDHLRLTVQKTELEIEQAQLEIQLAEAARALKQVDVDSAEHTIHERRIAAPIAGFVAEVMRHQGEWVQPGQTILRILRLDRLRAEGLASAQDVTGDLKGRKAILRVEIDGKPAEFTGTVTFVSPEIDPVNGQVRVWAEIDNPDLKLRPGLHGSLVIVEPVAQTSAR